jgi:hydrogenase nickel incorporation protein HypA/HybF
MHELGIIQSAVGMALETARAQDAHRIHVLRMRVGALSGVVPDALQFAFDLACQGTIAEGAVLEIETVAAACWCAACQREFTCQDFLAECPQCHAVSDQLRRGRELELVSVEVS